MYEEERIIDGQKVMVTVCQPQKRPPASWGKGFGKRKGFRGAAFLAQELNPSEKKIEAARTLAGLNPSRKGL